MPVFKLLGLLWVILRLFSPQERHTAPVGEVDYTTPDITITDL